MATRKKTTRTRTVRSRDDKPWRFVEDSNVRRLKKADPIGWSFCWNDHVARMNAAFFSLKPWKDEPLHFYTSLYRWHGLLLDITTNLVKSTSTFTIKG